MTWPCSAFDIPRTHFKSLSLAKSLTLGKAKSQIRAKAKAFRLPVIISTAIIGLGLSVPFAHAQTQEALQPPTNPYKLNRVVEDLPKRMKSAPAFYTVPAHKTPSGFPVPRYVSLKVGKANGRIGPSINHPVAWQYRRRGLPLIVVAETKRWRKVRDVNGDESWIYGPALSGERRAIAIFDTPLMSRDTEKSRVKAIALKGALVKIEECRDTGWCKFKSANGLKGWGQSSQFWGAAPLNVPR